MTGGCVFTGRPKGAASECGFRILGWRQLRNRLQIAEAEAAQVGKVQGSATSNVAEGVGTDVAIVGGIGHFADANAIENDPNDSIEGQYSK